MRPVLVWAAVDMEIRRNVVTMALLWEEYRAAHPDGFGYSWFCETYAAFRAGWGRACGKNRARARKRSSTSAVIGSTTSIVSRARLSAQPSVRAPPRERLVADVEVVVGEAAALTGEDAVVRVPARILRQADAVGRPLLHAPEDEVDAIGVTPRHPL
jgi:hypothetical protein